MRANQIFGDLKDFLVEALHDDETETEEYRRELKRNRNAALLNFLTRNNGD